MTISLKDQTADQDIHAALLRYLVRPVRRMSRSHESPEGSQLYKVKCISQGSGSKTVNYKEASTYQLACKPPRKLEAPSEAPAGDKPEHGNTAAHSAADSIVSAAQQHDHEEYWRS
jgi:hypothetical protein